MRTVAAVVFDLDGTLVDSRADIVAAANRVIVASGREALPADVIAGFVGDGARMLIAGVTKLPPSAPEVGRLLAAFIDDYTAHATDHTTLMPGAGQALEALARLPLALCTNKPRQTTEAVLRGLALHRHFQATVAGGDRLAKKPSPEPLLYLARELGVDPADLIMVGDGPQDVECAHNAGARAVGVEGGIVPRERLVGAGPDAMLSSLAELPDLVRAWSATPPRGDTRR